MAADAATGRSLLDPTATARKALLLGSVAARLDRVETGGVGTDEH